MIADIVDINLHTYRKTRNNQSNSKEKLCFMQHEN